MNGGWCLGLGRALVAYCHRVVEGESESVVGSRGRGERARWRARVTSCAPEGEVGGRVRGRGRRAPVAIVVVPLSSLRHGRGGAEAARSQMSCLAPLVWDRGSLDRQCLEERMLSTRA